jgi:hypothetical protein
MSGMFRSNIAEMTKEPIRIRLVPEENEITTYEEESPLYWEFVDKEDLDRVNAIRQKENPTKADFKLMDKMECEINHTLSEKVGSDVAITVWDGYDTIGEYEYTNE